MWWRTTIAMLVLTASTAHADPVVSLRDWNVDLTGFIQADVVPYSADSYDELDPETRVPLNNERFLIRRARLRADAHRGPIFGAIELDGNTISGSTARILGGVVGWRYQRGDLDLAITTGLFKIPFGAEVQTLDRDRLFLEPSAFARALFPGNYDAGAMVSGSYGLARWSLAAMNGAPPGDAQWHGTDPTQSYDFVGRIGAVVEGPKRFWIEAGVSGLTGTGLSPGTPSTKDELQWIDANQDGIVQTTELVTVPGGPGMPSQTFDRKAVGADIAAHWCICVIGTGTAFAEGVLATNLDRGLVYADPVRAGRDIRHAGFALGVVQNVSDNASVGVRYNRYVGDRDTSEQLGSSLVTTHEVFSTLSFVVTGMWNKARLMAQYDHERNPFGRGDDGMPATRDADRLTLRAQVGF